MGRKSRLKRKRNQGETRPKPERSRSAPSLPGLPPRPWRKVANLAIGLVLVLSIAAPTSYYLAGNPDDERFAWRMFSALRTRTCAVGVFEEIARDGRDDLRRRIRLSEHIHQGWISGMKRGRPDIVARFYDWRCREDPRITRVEIIRQCRSPGGERLDPIRDAHDCPPRAGEGGR